MPSRWILELREFHNNPEILWNALWKPDFCVVEYMKESNGFSTDLIVLSIPKDCPHINYLKQLKEQNQQLILSYFKDEPLQINLKQFLPFRHEGQFNSKPSLKEMLHLEKENLTGKGIKIAILDTGLSKEVNSYFSNIKAQIDFTDEIDASLDSVGHGSFVASILSSLHPQCPGIAPNSELYILKVFTSEQISLTSWFLNALNYCLFMEIDLINISIGSLNYLDHRFLKKINLVSRKSLVISAVGNEGPLYGTINNPADMLPVLGVGGIGKNLKLSEFSSRGMTLEELPFGIGRAKPDLVTFSKNIPGLNVYGDCQRMSGTSFSTPIITGLLALLMEHRKQKGLSIQQPMMKQLALSASTKLEGLNLFQQGGGMFDFKKALGIENLTTTAFPSYFNHSDCELFFPFCKQKLFQTSIPLQFNFSLCSSADYNKSEVTIQLDTDLIEFSYDFSLDLWGYLFISLFPNSIYIGTLQTKILIKSKNDLLFEIPLQLEIYAKPPKEKRILFDSFHTAHYPLLLSARDSLNSKSPLDSTSDHLYTNFLDFFLYLDSKNYSVEYLNQPLTCLDVNHYSLLILMDPEIPLSKEEQLYILKHSKRSDFSIWFLGDWIDQKILNGLHVKDLTTSSLKQPYKNFCVGGMSQSWNEFLQHFGMSLGGCVFSGQMMNQFQIQSSSEIIMFPENSLIFPTNDLHSESKNEKCSTSPNILGLTQLNTGGKFILFGDSSCFDSSQTETICEKLIDGFLEFTFENKVSDLFKQHARLLKKPLNLNKEQSLNYTLESCIDTSRWEAAQCYSKNQASEPLLIGKSSKIIFNAPSYHEKSIPLIYLIFSIVILLSVCYRLIWLAMELRRRQYLRVTGRRKRI